MDHARERIITKTVRVALCVLFAAYASADLQQPDLHNVEPQVREKITKLMAEAERNPNSAEAWGRLAMNLDVHDFKSQAVSCYERASQLAPNDFRWLYYRAILLFDQGSSDAIRLFRQSCALKPRYGPAHLRYGRALLHADRLEEAACELQLAASLSSDPSHAYLELARLEFLRGDWEHSRASALEAIRADPEFGEAYAFLSDLYRRKNMQHEAQEALLRSRSVAVKNAAEDPLLADLLSEGVSSFWYEWRGRTYLQMGKYDLAIDQLKSAVGVSAEPRLHDLLGIAYQYEGRYNDAVEQHLIALKADRGSAGTLNNLANALVKTGKVEEAIEYLKMAVRSEPQFAHSYVHLSALHLRRNKQDEAIAILQEGSNRIPQNREIALKLAWLLATSFHRNLRDGARAISLAEPVCKRNPDDAECLDVLAAAQAESGNFPLAIETARKAHALAVAKNQTDLAGRIEHHLKSYRSNKPYLE